VVPNPGNYLALSPVSFGEFVEAEPAGPIVVVIWRDRQQGENSDAEDEESDTEEQGPAWAVYDDQGKQVDKEDVQRVLEIVPRGQAVSVTIPGATSAGGASKEVRRLLTVWAREPWWTAQEEEIAVSCCRETSRLNAHWVVMQNVHPKNAAQLLYRTGSAVGFKKEGQETWMAREWFATRQQLPLVVWIEMPPGPTKQGVAQIWEKLHSAGIKHGGVFATEPSANKGRAGVRMAKTMTVTDAKKLRECADRNEWQMGIPPASIWSANGYRGDVGAALGVRQSAKFRQIPTWYAERYSERDLAQRLLRAVGGVGKVEYAGILPRFVTRETYVDIGCTITGENCSAMDEKCIQNENGECHIPVPCPGDVNEAARAMWPGTVKFVWTLAGAAPPLHRAKPIPRLGAVLAQRTQPGYNQGGKAKGGVVHQRAVISNGQQRGWAMQGQQPQQPKQGQQPRQQVTATPQRPHSNHDNKSQRPEQRTVDDQYGMEQRISAIEKQMGEMLAILTRRGGEPTSDRSGIQSQLPQRSAESGLALTPDRRPPALTSERRPPNSDADHRGPVTGRPAPAIGRRQSLPTTGDEDQATALNTERALRVQAVKAANQEKLLRVAAEKRATVLEDRLNKLELQMRQLGPGMVSTRDPKERQEPAPAGPNTTGPAETEWTEPKHKKKQKE
jgi:hypothetical protein